MTHKNKHEAGFTYIELIVIVIVLGILIGLAIPQFKKTTAYFELENLAKNIYFLCNYLQSASIAEAKVHCLLYLQESGELKSYFFSAEGQWTTSQSRTARLYKLPERITLEFTPREKTKIFFYPDGSIDSFEILFKNEFGHERALTVEGVSGGIKIK